MLWAYFSFSQFLIIWAGNLPEEIPYYLARLQGGWKYLSLLLVFGHFILPFCLLLSADLKKRPNLLARVAWFIIAIRLYDLIWLVGAGLQPGGACRSASRTSASRCCSPASGCSCSRSSSRKQPLRAGERPVLQGHARAGAPWGALRCRRSQRAPARRLDNPDVHHEESDINVRAIIWFVSC